MPWIIHGFRQNKEVAKKLIDAGFKLSFGMQLTKNRPGVNSIFSNLPEESFFFETDDEESKKINLIYESAAVIRKTIIEDLMKNQNKFFKQCFKVAI